jgi:oligopeptide/dipeptide ABC transporter ATP-binding protein
LLAVVPIPNPQLKRRRQLLQGDVPSPINRPPGCTFDTRCLYAEARCRIDIPALREISPGHMVACHLR